MQPIGGPIIEGLLTRVLVTGASAFLLGSVPCGYLVARAWGKDIRKWGSGRTGGTNVYRSCGPLPAILTVTGDALKAVVAIWLSTMLLGTGWGMVLAGSLAILGHIYTPFLGWRGGRGVVVAIAGLVFFSPACAVGVLAAAGVVVVASRYVSLASLTAATLMPISLVLYYLTYGGDYLRVTYGVVACLAIWIAHRDNVERLIRGTERRLGERATPTGQG